MLKYILKRIGFAILAIIILLLLVFFLMQAVPGYSIDKAANDTDESFRLKLEAAGLLKNSFEQLGDFIKKFFTTGEFGTTYRGGDTVYTRMLLPIQYTLMITLPAFIISSILGILLGILSAYYRGRWPDIVINGISVLFISIPSFIFALYLIQLAGFMGLPTQFISFADADSPWKVINSMIIPILSMVLASISTITYYTRNELVEVFKQDYIKVALAKGYTFRQVVFKYAFRNGAVPIVASLLPAFLSVLTGSIIIEKFFNVPGTAIELIKAIQVKEIYVVMFSAIFYGIIYFILQIMVDVSFTFIDPRIVLADKKADSYWKQFKAYHERRNRLRLTLNQRHFMNYFAKKHDLVGGTDDDNEVFTTGALIDKADADAPVAVQSLNYDKVVIHNTTKEVPKVNANLFQTVDIYNLSSEQIAGKPTRYVTDIFKRFFKSKSAIFFTVLLGIILGIGIINSLINLNTVSNPITDILPASVLAYLPPRIPWLGITGITDVVIDNDTYEALLPYEVFNIWQSAIPVGSQWNIIGFNPYNMPGMDIGTLFMGTDGLGRDWSNMLWYSTIKSFMFALIIAIPSVIIGTIYGAIAGSYAGRAADTVLMRIVEILSAVPLILWIIILGLVFSGETLDLLTIGVSMILVNWMWPAVTARTYILKYKDAEFIQAARTLGARGTRIIFSHMLPNISGRLFVRLVNMIPRIIFFEASLVFLGLKSATEISLGTMIDTSRLNTYPHLLFGPTIMMILLTLCAQIIANNLNDSLDPRVSGE